MYEIDANYFIRAVYNGLTMFYTGRLVAMSDHELAFTNCAWIADTGRFSNAMVTGVFVEVEPYDPDQLVVLNRSSVCELVKVKWNLPTEVK
jgi:hypothetical protein